MKHYLDFHKSYVYVDTNIRNEGLIGINYVSRKHVGKKLYFDREGVVYADPYPNCIHVHTYSDHDLLFGVKLSSLRVSCAYFT